MKRRGAVDWRREKADIYGMKDFYEEDSNSFFSRLLNVCRSKICQFRMK